MIAALLLALVAAAPPRDAGPGGAGPLEPAPAFLDVAWSRAGFHTGRAELITISVPPAAAPIRALAGTLKKKALVVLPASPDRRRWYALAAIDVDARPAQERLSIKAVLDDGSVLGFDKPVPIVEAPYDSRTLSVDKKFITVSKKDRQRAAKESVALEKALKKSDPARHWRGSFARPALGVETSPFGTKRTYNKKTKSRHTGWDLDGKTGDPIVASARGRVALSTDRFYSGGTVLIDHGQGVFTMYFHMSRRDVKVGQWVEKGEGIGAIGASGRVTGPHLHFTVKMAGLSIDPRFLLDLDLSADADDTGPGAGALDAGPPPAPPPPAPPPPAHPPPADAGVLPSARADAG